MAGNSRKDKKIKDLEYNVYRSHSELNNRGSHMNSDGHNGCVTLLAGIAITLAVCFVIVSAIQLGNHGSGLTCATAGCSNRVKSGSTYCWLHSAKSTKTRRPSGSSIFDSGKETPKPETKPRRKIFSGVGEENNNKVGGSVANSD